MKKLIISLSILLSSGLANAQTITADVTAKYAYSATGLFNKSISDLGASQDYDLAFSSNYGLAGTFNFGKIGLGVEYLMGNFNAGYQGTNGSAAYTSEVSLKTRARVISIQMNSLTHRRFQRMPLIRISWDI
jgi:hypothetical protein